MVCVPVPLNSPNCHQLNSLTEEKSWQCEHTNLNYSYTDWKKLESMSSEIQNARVITIKQHWSWSPTCDNWNEQEIFYLGFPSRVWFDFLETISSWMSLWWKYQDMWQGQWLPKWASQRYEVTNWIIRVQKYHLGLLKVVVLGPLSLALPR